MKVKMLAVIAIFITVFGVSVSYASLSTMIEISTTGSVRQANWDIHFEDISAVDVVGDVDIITAPQLSPNTTIIDGFDVRFNDVTGSVTYYFDVVNDGDLNAEISAITPPVPSCAAVGTVDPDYIGDKDTVCGAISYTLQYVEMGGTYVDLAVGDTLAAGERKRLRLQFSYSDVFLPANQINITGLDYLVTYAHDR